MKGGNNGINRCSLGIVLLIIRSLYYYFELEIWDSTIERKYIDTENEYMNIQKS